MVSAVTCLKYCRYGVKLYPINQSINQSINYFCIDSLEEYRCEGNIRINEDMEVLFSYNGGQIDSLCHAMTIIGRDAQNMKQYQLCLETLRYSDPDCEILTGLVSANSQVNYK